MTGGNEEWKKPMRKKKALQVKEKTTSERHLAFQEVFTFMSDVRQSVEQCYMPEGVKLFLVLAENDRQPLQIALGKHTGKHGA